MVQPESNSWPSAWQPDAQPIELPVRGKSDIWSRTIFFVQVYYSANINTGILNYVFSPDEKVSVTL